MVALANQLHRHMYQLLFDDAELEMEPVADKDGVELQEYAICHQDGAEDTL